MNKKEVVFLNIIYEPKGKAKEYAELAVNLYKGCGHGCKYCYAPKILRMSIEQFHRQPHPRKNVLLNLEKDCQRLQGDSRHVLLSFLSDPYQPIDNNYKLTRKAIDILKNHHFKLKVLTKGGLRATRDFDLLEPGDCVGATLTTTNIGASLHWEPEASLPEERFQMLRKAKEHGFDTWVSFEPIIMPRHVIDMVEITHEYVDEYKIGKLNYHPFAKEIHWSYWTREIVDCIRSYGKKLYVKEDLREYL
jgi:DNA repair photolyase